MKAVALALLLLASCDRWGSDNSNTALWSVPVSPLLRPDQPTRVFAQFTPTGEVVVAASDGRLADREVVGPGVARIDADGALVQLAAVADVAGYVTGARTDDRGRLVGVWTDESSSWIVGFDDALAPRWKLAVARSGNYGCCVLEEGVFDVGSQGQVAFARSDGGGTFTLHYLGEDGVERWAVPTPGYPHYIRIDPDGDVIMHPGGRFAAATGALTADTSLGVNIRASTRGGVTVGIEVGQDVPDQLVVREPTGEVRWQKPVEGIGYCAPGGCIGAQTVRSATIAITPSEDVLVQLYETTEARLDAATGDRLGTNRHCGAPAIVAVDDTGYLGLGPVCDAPSGLAKYALPE